MLKTLLNPLYAIWHMQTPIKPPIHVSGLLQWLWLRRRTAVWVEWVIYICVRVCMYWRTPLWSQTYTAYTLSHTPSHIPSNTHHIPSTYTHTLSHTPSYPHTPPFNTPPLSLYCIGDWHYGSWGEYAISVGFGAPGQRSYGKGRGGSGGSGLSGRCQM
jgi:hypothetical protein